jgi:hypothetical protein
MRSAALAWLALLAAGCAAPVASAPTAAPVPESWASQAEALEASGCKCTTQACFEQTRAGFDGLAAKNGGPDEAPIEAHAARGRFDACYRLGTFDQVRDVELATKAMCACADVKCVKRALAESDRVTKKYASAIPNEKDAEALGRLQADYDKCRAERVVAAAAWLTEVESLADATCACTDPSCIRSVGLRMAIRQRGTLVLGQDLETTARLTQTYDRMCKCAVKTGLVGGATSSQCHVDDQGMKARVEYRR